MKEVENIVAKGQNAQFELVLFSVIVISVQKLSDTCICFCMWERVNCLLISMTFRDCVEDKF